MQNKNVQVGKHDTTAIASGGDAPPFKEDEVVIKRKPVEKIAEPINAA